MVPLQPETQSLVKSGRTDPSDRRKRLSRSRRRSAIRSTIKFSALDLSNGDSTGVFAVLLAAAVCVLFTYAGYSRLSARRINLEARTPVHESVVQASLPVPRETPFAAGERAPKESGAVVPLKPPAVVLRAPAPLSDSEPAPLLESQLLQIPNRRQERNLSCEFQSATDLAAYYGHHFEWEELFAVVGYDPTGNPHKGFAGRSIDDPPGGIYPNGYGVYAEPIARGLQALNVAATVHRGKTAEWLRERIDQGHPTVVWATAMMTPQPTVTWQTTDGITVRGVHFEHTFTVVGYDESGVWVNDPYTASTDHYSWEQFESSWAYLGRMALTIDEELPGESSNDLLGSAP